MLAIKIALDVLGAGGLLGLIVAQGPVLMDDLMGRRVCPPRPPSVYLGWSVAAIVIAAFGTSVVR